MITPQQIAQKATRLYGQAVDAWLRHQDDAFFPRRIASDLKPSASIATAIDEVQRLREDEKAVRGFGYRIQWQQRQSRTHGLNEFPTAIFIDSLEDVAGLAKKKQELRTLAGAVAKLRAQQPRLDAWLLESTHWKTLLEAAEELDELLLVVDYFCKHPRPDCFARELPLPISTKLVQSHWRLLSAWLDRLLPPETIDVRYTHRQFEPRYGLRYVRPHLLLRTLDPRLTQELGLPSDELSMPAAAIAQLPAAVLRVVIVENKVNLLTLPPCERAIALGGLGNAVTQLSEIGWLDNAEIFYWGDLDVEGFEILARLRRRFAQVRSLLMDESTWTRFQLLAIAGNAVQRAVPDELSEDERAVCQRLISGQLRLEQERIPQSYVVQAFGQFPAPVQSHHRRTSAAAAPLITARSTE